MTLADEVLALLNHVETMSSGLTVKDAVERLAADGPSIRRAFEGLAETGRAKLARMGRGGGLHLLRADDPRLICVICHREFKPVRKETRTCSHSCARHLAWQNPDMRTRHSASLSAVHGTPEGRAKQAEISRKYLSDPRTRAVISERNRLDWANPEQRAKRLVSIERAWTDPGRVAKARDRLLEDWRNQAFREKTIAGMHNSERARDRRRIVEIAAQYPKWTYGEIGSRVGRSSASVSRVLRRARKNGEIGIRPGDNPRVKIWAAKSHNAGMAPA